jgi:hypothetical protein
MQTISIGELQKNVGILTRLTETLTIVDKRRNRNIAVVYPIEHPEDKDVVSQLVGSLSQYVPQPIGDLKKIKEEAMMLAMKEKYGFTD